MDDYKFIESAMLARGKKELLTHLSGGRLTIRQAALAKCYDCMGYFIDGKIDCELKRCALYPYMPYNPNRIKSTRVMSEKQKESIVKMRKKPP